MACVKEAVISKTLRTVALVAGAVALVATGIGAAAGVGVLGAAASGTASAVTIAGVSTATIASVATVVSVAASIGAQLTAKKPAAQGSITEVTVQIDPPQPYLMGRSYSAGIMRHDAGYGPEIDKIKNPYRGIVIVYSGGGPVQETESFQFDYKPVSFTSGWYDDFGGTDGQLGLTPEPDALAPTYSPMTNWGPAYKLSGQCAALWNFKFDKDAKRYASGIPPYGLVIKGVKAYDPRLDSTYPGGSGSQRITDETTWTWTENPGLHAITYIYGRHQNGKKVFGIGMPVEGIDLARYVELANVCDLNNWKVGGSTFEPGDKWENLKDILAAGGSEPIFAGGKLSCRVQAPKIAIDTVTEDDLADADMEVTTAQSYRDRLNGVVPKFRSELNNWQYVSVETVSVPEYVTEDGEEKTEETQFNLVQQATQAAQLAAYQLVDGREMGPITITLKPFWRRYMPGECIHLLLPAMELDHDAIILTRELNPADLTVTLTLISETPGKHAFALGQTAVAPIPPGLTDSQERDEAAIIGEDGVSPVGLNVSPPTITIQLDASGAVKPGQLPVEFTPNANQGGSPIAITSLTITSSTGGTWSEDDVNISLDAVAGGASSGECTYTVEAAGQTLAGNIVTFATSSDGSSSSEVTKSWTASVGEANSASFAPSGPELAVDARADGTLDVNFTGGITPDTDFYQFAGKMQYSTNGGGSWADVAGSTHDSTVSSYIPLKDRYSACVTNSTGPYNITGLGASTPCLIRAMIMKKAGAPSTGTTSSSLQLFADNG